jgi:ABC-type sugar transport system ATPase subunit
MSEAAERQASPATNPIVELRDVSKAFGHVVAIDRVSLVAYPGEVLALVGDNGAGKSTVIKIIAGVHDMDSGELLVEGEPVELRGPGTARELGIATVFQDLSLVECLDIAANMYLGRPPRRLRFFADHHRMIEGAADTLHGLKIRLPSVRVPVGALSGGQRQAVAIARAALQKGRVMLMDEPTAALGVRETEQVLDLIDEVRDQGVAVVLVSHDLETVFRVADRIQVMRLGRVEGVRQTADTDRNEIVGMITGAFGAGPHGMARQTESGRSL